MGNFFPNFCQAPKETILLRYKKIEAQGVLTQLPEVTKQVWEKYPAQLVLLFLAHPPPVKARQTMTLLPQIAALNIKKFGP